MCRYALTRWIGLQLVARYLLLSYVGLFALKRRLIAEGYGPKTSRTVKGDSESDEDDDSDHEDDDAPYSDPYNDTGSDTAPKSKRTYLLNARFGITATMEGELRIPSITISHLSCVR